VSVPQLRGRGRLDAGRLSKPRQRIVIRLARVAAHNAAQRRIGLECRRVDPSRFAFDQIRGRVVSNNWIDGAKAVSS
jgi:hypothetical protein